MYVLDSMIWQEVSDHVTFSALSTILALGGSWLTISEQHVSCFLRPQL